MGKNANNKVNCWSLELGTLQYNLPYGYLVLAIKQQIAYQD